MKPNKVKQALIAVVILSIIGFGFNAMADSGNKQNRQDGKHGMHQTGEGCPIFGDIAKNLSDDELKKVKAERTAFQNATGDLQQQVLQKRLALESELAKDTPDAQQAAQIQKEISQIEAQLDLKWVDHVIAMKKINPKAFRGHMFGHGAKKGCGMGCGRYCRK